MNRSVSGNMSTVLSWSGPQTLLLTNDVNGNDNIEISQTISAKIHINS